MKQRTNEQLSSAVLIQDMSMVSDADGRRWDRFIDEMHASPSRSSTRSKVLGFTCPFPASHSGDSKHRKTPIVRLNGGTTVERPQTRDLHPPRTRDTPYG